MGVSTTFLKYGKYRYPSSDPGHGIMQWWSTGIWMFKRKIAKEM
jgi:hypothetical protein